jgi:hypothetical protein
MASEEFWSSVFGVKLYTFVAGVIGGAIKSVVVPGDSYVQAAASMIVGGFVAAYGTPLALWWFKIPEGSGPVERGLGFFMGVMGMVIVGGAFAGSKKWSKKLGDSPPPGGR